MTTTPKPTVIPVTFDTIPVELTSLPRWLLWRYDWHADRNEYAKVPYQTNGRKARANDERTWTDYATVAARYRRGGYDGIGIALGDGLAGGDLDACLANGCLTDFATSIIGDTSTYVEISPSGLGLKLYGFVSLETSGKGVLAGNIFELYRGCDTQESRPKATSQEESASWEQQHRRYGRWFAVTGHAYHGTAVTDDTGPFQRLVDALTKYRSDKGRETAVTRLLDGQAARIRNATEGARHNTMVDSGRAIVGALLGLGIDPANVADTLTDLGSSNGLPAAEAQEIATYLAHTIPADTPLPDFESPAVTAAPPSRDPSPSYCVAPKLPTRATDLDRQNPAPPRVIIPNMFQSGLAFFIGQAGIGKTPILQQLALAFAAGGVWLDSIRVPHIPTLYIGVEYSEGQILQGLRSASGGDKMPDDLYVFGLEQFNPPETEADALEALDYYATALGIGVIIVDMLTGFLPQEKYKQTQYRGDYKEFLTYQRWALRRDALFVGAWHGTKRDTNPATMYNGGMGMWGGGGGGRIVMYEQDGEKRLYSQLRGHNAQDWIIQEVSKWGRRYFAILDSDPDPVFTSEAQRQVYTMLKSASSEREPLTPGALYKLLESNKADIPAPYVRKILRILEDRGFAQSTPAGAYFLNRPGSQGSQGSSFSSGSQGSQGSSFSSGSQGSHPHHMESIPYADTSHVETDPQRISKGSVSEQEASLPDAEKQRRDPEILQILDSQENDDSDSDAINNGKETPPAEELIARLRARQDKSATRSIEVVDITTLPQEDLTEQMPADWRGQPEDIVIAFDARLTKRPWIVAVKPTGRICAYERTQADAEKRARLIQE